MGEAGHAQQTIRFGVFEVDLHSGELRKAGVRIKLQEQPFKILTALLERPGEVVTREELRRRIWPHQSSGDFDHAVNIAVAKLRTALGDSAEAPRLIETLYRRGYRFIFPVSRNGSKAQASSVALRHPTGNEAGTSEAEANVVISDRGRTPDSIFGISARSRWSRGISVFGLILVVGGTIAWFIRPVPPPTMVGTRQLTHDGLTKTGVLTDGSRLYITESTGSKQFLVEASATGGESTILQTPFANIVTSDISPDHSEMLVADAVGPQYEFPVWILPLPSGPPRRLADITARCDTWSSQGWATWSPDGRQIAFAKGSDIYLANADGSDVKKLITLSGYASEIRFSPDGTHLRFTLRHFQNNRSASIFDVRANGSDLHPLFPGWKTSFSHMAGDWSRDGRYYFFTFCEGSNSCSIWTTRERHGFFSRQPSPPIQLTNGPMSVYFNGISPDGRRIFAGGWTARTEVVRYDPGSRQFVPFLGGISATELDFSRDGKWVTYVSHPEGGLWRSRVDGSERLQLTAPPVSALLPRWSPDGSQIAFVDERAGLRWKIFLMPAQGGTPREMLAENQYQMDPNWSPDGKQLVFGRVPWLKGTDENISIQIFDLDFKNVSTIPGSENLFAPRWSPDGQYLAALSGDGKNLLMYEFKTRKWRHWLSESGDIEQPEWSRDGKYIYYSNTSTSNPSYRRVQVGRHRSEFLIDLKTLHRGGTDPAAAALGPWSALAPDGSALFGRDLSSDEVYSLEVELP
jgi:Tol biopolymer transport system component/DNA-binding winged helix-turn-helix (wHTH) protein